MRKTTCLICGSLAQKDVIKLHQFPKNLTVLPDWIKFCQNAQVDVRPDDNFTYSYICNQHFKPTDYKGSRGIILRKDAIPSIFPSSIPSVFRETVAESSITLEYEGSDQFECSDIKGVADVSNSPDISASSEPTIKIEREDTAGSNFATEVSIEENRGCLVTEMSPGKKRKIYHGDFNSFDMTNPRMAKRFLRVSQTVLKEKNQKIDNLYRKCLRMKRKIGTLKGLFKRQRTESFSLEDAEEMILPSDTGYLDDSRVYQVVRRGEKAVHQVDKKLEVGKMIKQKIDWEKREDHMQQHSGQHLISAIFEKEHKMETISWWLGEEVSYIELENASVNSELLEEVERRVNNLIQEELKVYATILDSKTPSKEFEQMQSRKGLPLDHAGDIRIINIEGIDSNMCCGTHVNNTCQLQHIKLLHAEKSKRKNNTLVYFLCGKRVLKKLSDCLCREQKLTSILKSNPVSHVDLVEKLQKNVKVLSKNLQGALRNIASYEAEKLKHCDPLPKYYCLHRKDAGPEFMSVFIQELGREDILLFLSTDEGNKNGNIVLFGPLDLVQNFGPKICEILKGKGAGKGNRFQAKVSDITNISKAEKLIKEYFSE